ncbi:putative phage replisome organizer/uncharacterized phage protein (TIGR02220 family) [Planomicrobium soli]|uniref:Putative phage replisome organizer/uncharacterized phage protein (TIGR02220 family) n=1 Tax=Planomicrobium soli TaxID=1176648 RepID=A0A2P8H7G0_9BACL|nr:phage replisome organizer N-terminal domain-containing protein [Planomicrobium soli]PSL42158.1 putative phage replisome organizer/uncharacterized phage protein (TIGR02220 family) [Planomicrobium soli]
MSGVKWIKLSTQMFEDEKIRLIESMPEADTILIVWVKLLSQAGRANANGYIYLSETIPYTDEMLATIFNRPLGTVRMALEVFQQFGMIDIDDNHFISIINWDKHQSIEGLDKIREQTRLRVEKHRERKKLPIGNVTETLHDNAKVTDIEEELELEEDKERDKEKENVPFVEIVNYLNDVASTNYRHQTQKTKDLIKARWKEGFRLEDFKRVVDTKTAEWIIDEKMAMYLRPTTLFGTNFESYLNQKPKGANRPGSHQQHPKKSNDTSGIDF